MNSHKRHKNVFILLCLLWLISLPAFAQVKKTSVWEGAYTSEQADRGEKAYTANCAGCHQADLGGKGEIPALKGDNFMERWHDYSVKPLFEMIKTEMPPLRFRTPDTKPLPDNVYVDIITYIFKNNGFPAGQTQLTLDTLDKVQILGRNGVQPAPQFALVLTVGCMSFRRAGWTVTSATEPVRATMPDIGTPDEVTAAKRGLLGLREYRLADFGYLGRGFSPGALEGHRILVKGYIIRQREFERISVTAVTDVAPDCE
ncbi:MAG TPA: cytochrome c [Terriglobia bacterium]|nr:cytochrome c [Terriglobia bacterium]